MSEQKPNAGRAVVPSPAESGKSQPVPSGTPNAPRTSRASGAARSAQRAVAVAAPNAVQPRDTFAHPAYAGSGSDFDFMRDMQQAMVNDRQKSSFLLLVLMVALLVSAAIWAHYSKLEEITKGDARIIASSREQVIQSLEGGILAEMLVREGATVEKGQPLLRIDETKARSSYKEGLSKVISLKASAARLRAEARGTPLQFPRWSTTRPTPTTPAAIRCSRPSPRPRPVRH